jgi:hypothetical protein
VKVKDHSIDLVGRRLTSWKKRCAASASKGRSRARQ